MEHLVNKLIGREKYVDIIQGSGLTCNNWSFLLYDDHLGRNSRQSWLGQSSEISCGSDVTGLASLINILDDPGSVIGKIVWAQ